MRLAVLILVVILLLTLAAPLIAPFDPMSTTAGPALQSPNSENLLGTDLLGRDVLSRVLYGGRRTLVVAAEATLIAVLPGLLIGVTAGTAGRRVNRFITVFINSWLAIPALIMALVVLTLLGSGVEQLAIAVGIAYIAVFAQVIRSATLSVRSAGYIEAAQALGATGRHIVIRHITPNVRPTLYSYTGVIFSYSILNSAALSFLGLGGDPSIPDWGTILADGRLTFQVTPWVAVAPGLLIVMTVMAVNRLADYWAAHDF